MSRKKNKGYQMKYTFSTELLRQRFTDSKLTFRQISDLSGVQKTTVHRIIGKNETPSIEHLIALCDALGISPRSLFYKSK